MYPMLIRTLTPMLEKLKHHTLTRASLKELGGSSPENMERVEEQCVQLCVQIEAAIGPMIEPGGCDRIVIGGMSVWFDRSDCGTCFSVDMYAGGDFPNTTWIIETEDS